MESLLGFKLDIWDYATFAALIIIGAAIGVCVILILGLPGKIAVARKHPDEPHGLGRLYGYRTLDSGLDLGHKADRRHRHPALPKRGAGGH